MIVNLRYRVPRPSEELNRRRRNFALWRGTGRIRGGREWNENDSVSISINDGVNA